MVQYRDLRSRYYGCGGYDFGEDELLAAGMRVSASRPDAAIALLQLNVEFYPRSSRSYIAMAQAATRKFADADAIAYLEKALEIDPENGAARGQLTQLQRFQRR